MPYYFKNRRPKFKNVYLPALLLWAWAEVILLQILASFGDNTSSLGVFVIASTPFVPLALMSVVGPFPHLRKLRKLTRFCQQCRYDLTGNQSGVCPECGIALNAEQQEYVSANESG